MTAQRWTTHGHTKKGGNHPLYSVWAGIKSRTENPKSPGWHNYGGRGIKMCSRWRNSFENFLEDMGKRPSKKHSIDRIDNDGDYTPENCRWATKEEQSNNMRKNVNITMNGETKTISEWCRIYDINYPAALWRLHNGWSVEDVFSIEPFRGRNNRE